MVSSMLSNAGAPAKMTEFWRDNKFLLLLSPEILKEYLRLFKKFGFEVDKVIDMAELFSDPMYTLMLHPKTRFNEIADDPTDDKFLDCAVEGKADAIVSGDKHLLRLEKFHGVPILKPRAFLNKFFPGA